MRVVLPAFALLASPALAAAQDCMVLNNMMMCSNGFMSFNAPPVPVPPGTPGMATFHTFGEPGMAPGATQWSSSQTLNADGTRTERRETATRMPDGTVRRDVDQRIVFPDGRSCRVSGGRMNCE